MNRIRIEDLSVGDWVKTESGKLVQIDSISRSDIFVGVLNGSNIVEKCLIDEIEPIPITSEILCDFGFKRIEYEVKESLHILGDCEVYKMGCDEDWNFLYRGDFLGHLLVDQIRYLHQLQHCIRMSDSDIWF